MAYFDCIVGSSGGKFVLTVTCSSAFAGLTITCTDGTTTLTQTCPSSSPYEVEFKIPNGGTWTISSTVGGVLQSISVVIPDSAELNVILDGATVTPVNDIQIWLHCANIWDKAYTTINEVLADASTLQALIASNNAADYMARSTSWASSVTANANAMTYIGANDYCAETLLGDSTWLNAICNSAYFESVLNAKVPTMTSNTAPSGEASADSNSGNGYKGFDNNNSTYWEGNTVTGTNSRTGWLQYKFTQPTVIRKLEVVTYSGDNWSNGVLLGSNSGNNDDFAEIATFSGSHTGVNYGSSYNRFTANVDNNTAYLYYRFKSTSYRVNGSSGNYGEPCIYTLQMYGREE